MALEKLEPMRSGVIRFTLAVVENRVCFWCSLCRFHIYTHMAMLTNTSLEVLVGMNLCLIICCQKIVDIHFRLGSSS